MAYVEPLLSSAKQISWEPETTYKTRPTNINNWIRTLTHEIPIPDKDTTPDHAFGAGREPHYVNDYKKETLEGSFEFEVETGEFLGAIFGSVVTTGTDPYTHNITVIDTMLPSFAIQCGFEKAADDLVMEFLGCRVNSATFKVSEDSEKLMCTVDYYAAKPQDGGSSLETVTPTTTTPYMFKFGVFSSTSLYAGAKARVHDFECKINNNCKHNHVAGAEHYPYDILPGRVDYGELKITVGVEDDTEWDEVLGARGTSHDFEMLFTRGANDTLKISGTAKLKTSPFSVDENDVRATLTLIPDHLEIEVVDSITTYPFE